MKIIRAMGIIDAILLIIAGVLYFVGIKFPNGVFFTLLIILVFCAALQKIKTNKE